MRYIKTIGFSIVILLFSLGLKAQEKTNIDTAVLQVSDTITLPKRTIAKETTPLESNQSQSPMWIPLILSLLALAGLFFLWLTKMDKKDASTPPDFYRKDFHLETQHFLKSIQALKAQQAVLEEQIKVLEAQKSAAVEKQAVAEKTPEPAIEEEVPIPNRTWYAVVPKNGTFFGRQLTQTFKAREHIYRIEVLDEERAYYYLVDDNATRQHAFNIPDSYILPAMELEGNGRLAEATHIEIQRGSLIKAGNNWQIEEKAVLNYTV